jgi:hypothetical protein
MNQAMPVLRGGDDQTGVPGLQPRFQEAAHLVKQEIILVIELNEMLVGQSGLLRSRASIGHGHNSSKNGAIALIILLLPLPHNVGSIRVLEKCGFSLEHEESVEVAGKDVAELVLVLR